MNANRLGNLVFCVGIGLLACRSSSEQATSDRGQGVPSKAAALDPMQRHLASLSSAERSGWSFQLAPSTDFVLAWRVHRGELMRDEYLDLDVVLWSEGQPLANTALDVLGWMPAHGHGFQRRTEVESLAPGRFLVHGVLFHMRGNWQVTFDVSRAGLVDKLIWELSL